MEGAWRQMVGQDVKKPPNPAPAFREDLHTALQGYRSAIIELLAAIGADSGKPQDLSRQFKLNKNLTWKISKIAAATDLYAIVPHIPGSIAMEIFLRAMQDAAAPRDLVETARRAAKDFEQVVTVHTGDRATLEIMVNGLLPAAMKSDRDEQNRKLGFQGNSAAWGVRAHVQLTLNLLAPNADDPDKADLVQVGGLDGFRRLRRDARWLLFRRERWADDDPRPEKDEARSLDPNYPVEKGVPLLGEFCSKPIPAIDVVVGEGEDQFELPPGPVGNAAAFTCIYGQIAHRVGGTYAEHEGEYAEIGCNMTTPVEVVLFDLLVHRELDWAMNPELVMYSRMDGGALHRSEWRSRNLLQVEETVHDLGWGVGGLATPIYTSHTKLVRYVLDTLKWNADDFRAFRFTMSYPPIPTVALLRSKLPVRATSTG